MGADDNAKLLRRGYEAFGAGDMTTLAELLAEDAVWHIPGKSRLSGDKRGRDAILAYFGELFSLSGGTFRATLHDVVGGEEHTIGLHHNGGERDGKVMDQNAAVVFHIRGGRYLETWEFHGDEANWEAFWS